MDAIGEGKPRELVIDKGSEVISGEYKGGLDTETGARSLEGSLDTA